VGSTELESVTSCVSSRRSNQLSYEPSNCERTGVRLESTRSPKPQGSAPGVQMASKSNARKPLQTQNRHLQALDLVTVSR
jgi:hypothetical protein